MMRRTLITVIVCVCAVASEASAQVVRRPARPYRGLFGAGPTTDPNRTRQELTLTTNLLAGYDDMVTPGGSTGPVQPGQRFESGYTGFGDLNLRYWRGRTVRSVTIESRAYGNTYSVSDARSTAGGSARFAGTGTFGRHRLDVTQSVSYDPSLVLGAFDSIRADVDSGVLPDSGQETGYIDQRSWSLNSNASIERRMTPRQTLAGGVSYFSRNYVEGLGFDSRTQAANARHSWARTRTTSLVTTYRFSDSRLDGGDGLITPIKDHNVDFGLSYAKRLSLTRQFQLSVGGGTTYVQTVHTTERTPLDYWTPAARVMTRLDVGQSWAVAGDYRRGLGVLQGVSLESFATDALSVRADGTIGRRAELAFSTAYANGRSGEGGENPSRFESYGASAQLRYALARCCAAAVYYDYYLYRLHDVRNLTPGVPPEYDRHAVRVGLSLWLPLFGAYVDRERGASRD